MHPPHPLLTIDDLPADDEKARAALSSFTMSLVASAKDPDFEPAYALLDLEFSAKGELETKDAVRGYFARAKGALGYKMVVARDAEGNFAGVRDCHVSVDAAARIFVVFLSHVLVLPAYRRSGLGSLLRHVPVAFGRRAVLESKLAEPVNLILAAEMEPVAEGATDTLVRLVAYGRAGFKIIDPRHLPYCQPDYREHARIDADRVRPVPLLAVIRWVDHEAAHEVPCPLAAAFVEHVYRNVAPHCREADMAAPPAHALATLASSSSGKDTIPLLDPPRTFDDRAALVPLARDKILAYYPASLLGDGASP